MAIQSHSKNKIETRIAVRTLVEFVHRTGGLSSLTYHQLSANAGTRTHQAFFDYLRANFPNHAWVSEFTLQGAWDDPQILLKIGGRADLLILPQGTTFTQKPGVNSPPIFLEEPGNKRIIELTQSKIPFFCEIKTINLPLSELNPEGEPLHWSQVMMYTALYYFYRPDLIEAITNEELLPDLLSSPGLAELNLDQDEEAFSSFEIPFILSYISQTTLECRILERTITLSKLWAWFKDTIHDYLRWAKLQANHNDYRDHSIVDLPFPYETPREGQNRFMESVERSLRTGEPLMAQAPTGSGKTISTMYPALQSLSKHEIQRIFYLTAKTSTREVAEQALEDLRKIGLYARQVTLTAKEQMCLAPELYCDTTVCPYAVSYYERLDEGLERTLQESVLKKDLLMKLGEEFGLCPFELSLDAAIYCDVIIGDYNYALDPRVKLDRFFGESEEREGLLFDEAHNLADRSREMFSATLDIDLFKKFHTELPDRAIYYKDLLNQMILYLQTIHGAVEAQGQTTLDYLTQQQGFNPETHLILEAQGFCGLTAQPLGLVNKLRDWLKDFRNILDDELPPPLRRQSIELIGTVRFFLQICDEYWDDSYIVAMRYVKEKFALRLICLNASNFIAKLYYPRHAAVFFSATLTPFAYYRQILSGEIVRPQELNLPSPFELENLQTLVLKTISTRFKDRQQSKLAIARAIVIAQRVKRGQMIVYFPSYAYLQLVLPEVLTLLPEKVHLTIQKPHLSPPQREAWVENFRNPAPGKEVLGFAVLGGLFAEGIDLIGEQLTGVIIVGTGLPGISPERNIMQQYYDEHGQHGYHTAYTWPGFNKVQQAAGRLIRTATDKGFILLLDDRYQQSEYLQLFPEHWQPLFLNSERELLDALKEGRRGERSYGGFQGLGATDDQVQDFGSVGGVQDSPW